MTTFSRAQLLQNRAFRTVKRTGVTLDLTPASAGNGAALFTVSGPVLVYSLFGEITTVIGAGLAVPQLQFLSGATLSALCAAAASIAALPARTLLRWSGLLAGLLTPNVGLGHLDLTAAQVGFIAPLVFGMGSVRLTNTVSALSGIIDWYITYLPMDDTTIVTAA